MEPHFYKTVRYEGGEEIVTGFWWPYCPNTPDSPPILATVTQNTTVTEEASIAADKSNVKPPHQPFTKLAESSRVKLLERLEKGMSVVTKEWAPVAALMWERGMLKYNDEDGYYL